MSGTDDPIKIRALDRDGRSSRVKTDYLEIDCGGAGRFLISFSHHGGGSAALEIIAEVDGGEPSLSVQPGASNAVTLRLDLPEPVASVEDVTAPVVAPILKLTVQRALEGDDRALAPRKHRIRRWAQAALRNGMAEVTVRLVGEEEGRMLNRDYRDKDYATNILTFTYDAEERTMEGADPVLWGDLVLCVPVVIREALEQNKSPDAHFAHLVVHGMLHLQGFDHESSKDAKVMERIEKEVLASMGYADPYA